MFHKLLILILMQLSEKFKIDPNATKGQKLGMIGKVVAKMGISYGIFVGLFLLIFNVLFLRATLNLFIFFIFIMQLLSIISQTVSLSDKLYMSKDNAILLTYPVRHELTYVSKLLVAYIIELYKSLLFVFPIFMAYMTINSSVISFHYIFGAVIFSVLLPLFPVLIGALISIPLAYFKKAIKKYTIVKLAGLGLLIGLCVFITISIINILPDEIRIVPIWNMILNRFNEMLENINQFSLYNQFIGNAMYGNQVLLNYLYVFLTILVVGSLSILISMPLFFKIASSSTENAVIKEHEGKNVVNNSVFRAFMKKELLLSIRNIGDFASDYLFLFVMPFILPIVTAIFTRVDRNDLGVAMTYAFVGLFTLILLSASSTAAATAISSEGNEFVLLKTAPSNTSKIVWSKLLMNCIISFVMVTITFIVLSIMLRNDSNLDLLWVVYFVIIIVDFGIMCWSIQLDIRKPKLKEYASSEKRSDVNNFSKSIAIGCLTAVFFSVLITVVIVLKLPLLTTGLILVAVALLFSGLRLYFLVNYTKYYFNSIEL